MDDAQRAALTNALREAAQRRSDATEKAQLAEIDAVWDRIPDETRRIFDYIKNEIPKRTEASDVAFLRETRALHFRPFRKYLDPKEHPYG